MGISQYTTQDKADSSTGAARRCMVFFLFGVLAIPAQTVWALTPNDPSYEQWGYADTFVEDAWEEATGSSDVVVAIIDNGVDIYHPDLSANIWTNLAEIPNNGLDDDSNGYNDDIHGWNFVDDNNNTRPSVVGETPPLEGDEPNVLHHGTVVAGIIGAVGNNEQDGAGINWHVQIMPLKIVGNSGSGDTIRIGEAIEYAVDNGADVINASFVGNVTESVEDAVKYAFDHGVAFIAAAGNDMRSLNIYPRDPVCADVGEETQWVLGVSAIGEDHYLAGFSNTGADCIDITAPGVNISSTLRYAPRQGFIETFGGGWTGTSFATPFVTGAAALIKSINPDWGPTEIYTALLSTVHRTPPDDVAAYEDLYGAGLLQIDKAVAYAIEHGNGKKSAQEFLFYFNTHDGYIHKRHIDTAEDEVVTQHQQLITVDDVATFESKKEIGFATVKQRATGIDSQVTVYDENWQRLHRWQVAGSGAFAIAVADVSGDSGLEVIVAPQQSSATVIEVYSVDGEFITNYTLTQGTHGGVGLFVYEPRDEEKAEILVAYKHDGLVQAKHLLGDMTVKLTVPLSYVQAIPSVAAGNLDTDDELEYIIGAGVGESPWVGVFEEDGTLKRWFYVGPLDSMGGMELGVAEYADQGAAEIFVSPEERNHPATVWSARGKKVAEWQAFGRGDLTVDAFGII